MITINGKDWSKLRFSDIRKLLSSADDESFFFEFKSDDVSNQKLIQEVSAFANTFGGYILIGINDDKSIGGCHKWTENRIHTTIHDSITPVPSFDVKRYKPKEGTVLIIRIEEGKEPPYVTNKGKIYERVSSGSFVINDSSKITQLYQKRQDQINQIRQKIELESISINQNTPQNLVGYIDMGFSLTTSELTQLQLHFFDFDFSKIVEYLKSLGFAYSLSSLGDSYVICIGALKPKASNGESVLLSSGINNFIEIKYDGSIRSRILLCYETDDNEKTVDVAMLSFYSHIHRKIYETVFGENFHKIFISAQKYEKLTVIKQFHPVYRLGHETRYKNYHDLHSQKYGDTIIIGSNRVPSSNYSTIDKKYITNMNNNYSLENLLFELFFSHFYQLGYIDPITAEQLQD